AMRRRRRSENWPLLHGFNAPTSVIGLPAAWADGVPSAMTPNTATPAAQRIAPRMRVSSLASLRASRAKRVFARAPRLSTLASLKRARPPRFVSEDGRSRPRLRRTSRERELLGLRVQAGEPDRAGR